MLNYKGRLEDDLGKGTCYWFCKRHETDISIMLYSATKHSCQKQWKMQCGSGSVKLEKGRANAKKNNGETF